MIIAKHNVKIMIGEHEVPLLDFSMKFSYARFTEYGRPPEPTNVIDSDAIVIDEDVLALPAPGQKEIENDL